VNDAVDRILIEREALEQGLGRSLAFSGLLHALLVGAPLLASLLIHQPPPIRIVDGFAVQIPRGGGGTPQLEPPARAPQPTAPPETAPAKPKEEPAPKILKPPKEDKRKGLPELDAKKGKKPKPEKEKPAARATSGASPAGTGASNRTPGIEWAPAGPGLPDGTDLGGDWYLASVQQRIWTIWVQQVKSGMTQPVIVSFTILSDGSVTDVELVQSSGASLLDLSARRAIYSAAPFGPLPKHYGINRITIQGIFKPSA
jgi:TonB family protein